MLFYTCYMGEPKTSKNGLAFFFYSNPVPHLVDYTMKSTQRASTLVSNSTSAFISVSDKWLRARNKQAYLSGHHVFP